jgi:hypothetical protein
MNIIRGKNKYSIPASFKFVAVKGATAGSGEANPLRRNVKNALEWVWGFNPKPCPAASEKILSFRRERIAIRRQKEPIKKD